MEGAAFCSVFEQPHFGQTPLSSVQSQPQPQFGACAFGTGRVGTSGSQPPPLEVEEEDDEEEGDEELDPLTLLVEDGLLVEDVLLVEEVLLGDDVLLVLLVDDVLLGEEVLLVLLVEDVLLGDEVLLVDDVLLGDEVLLVEDVLLVEEVELSDDPMGGSVELLLLLLDELEELDEGMDGPPDPQGRLRPQATITPHDSRQNPQPRGFTWPNAECYKIRAELVRSGRMSHLIVRRF